MVDNATTKQHPTTDRHTSTLTDAATHLTRQTTTTMDSNTTTTTRRQRRCGEVHVGRTHLWTGDRAHDRLHRERPEDRMQSTTRTPTSTLGLDDGPLLGRANLRPMRHRMERQRTRHKTTAKTHRMAATTPPDDRMGRTLNHGNGTMDAELDHDRLQGHAHAQHRVRIHKGAKEKCTESDIDHRTKPLRQVARTPPRRRRTGRRHDDDSGTTGAGSSTKRPDTA